MPDEKRPQQPSRPSQPHPKPHRETPRPTPNHDPKPNTHERGIGRPPKTK